MPKAYGFTSYGGPETEAMLDVAMPEPGPDEVVIAVRAAGVNPADWKIRAGQVPQFVSGFPTVLGREAAGIVVALGANVESFQVGDEVFGRTPDGSIAEYARIPAATLAPKPAGVSFADAATLPVAAATAYDGIVQLDLQPGDTFLITGVGGGVGVAAAQIARHRGARVIGTASEAKRAFVESLGVVHVAYGDGVADRVRAVAPDGVDAIYDMVGHDALRAVASVCRDPSRLLGVSGDPTVVELGGRQVDRKNTSEVLVAVAALVEEGVLDPKVTHRVPFAQAGEAMRLVESGHATGKVVVEFDRG